jgi:hypothetical protein
MLFREIMDAYSEKSSKHINIRTFCEQNAEFLNIKSGGTYGIQRAASGSNGTEMQMFGYFEALL